MAGSGADFEERAAGFGTRIADAGLRGLVLRFGDETRIIGVVDRMPPAATLEASVEELSAALAGRYTSAELRAMRWIGDPEPYIALLGSDH